MVIKIESAGDQSYSDHNNGVRENTRSRFAT